MLDRRQKPEMQLLAQSLNRREALQQRRSTAQPKADALGSFIKADPDLECSTGATESLRSLGGAWQVELGCAFSGHYGVFDPFKAAATQGLQQRDAWNQVLEMGGGR